jgi:hypothetical protein
MAQDVKPYIDWILASAGLSGVIWGIFTYKDAQTTKRADTLLPLIEEFDSITSEMFIAKEIIDDKRISARAIFDDKSSDPTEYDIRKLDLVLRYDEQRTFTAAEVKIRSSFDSFLDFLCKLEYLLEIKVLKKHEIRYFNYYIDRAAKIDAVVDYANAYHFPLHGNLCERFNVQD